MYVDNLFKEVNFINHRCFTANNFRFIEHRIKVPIYFDRFHKQFLLQVMWISPQAYSLIIL